MKLKLSGKLVIFIIVMLGLGAGVLSRSVWVSRIEKADAIYYCPMHPTYVSNRPGDCPICNMKLVKKENPAGPETPAAETGHEGHEAGESDGLKTVTVQELLQMKPGEICLLHKCKMGQCMIAMTEDIARLGKCPHCGEDLGVIVKDLAPSGYGEVRIGEDKQQMIGVKTAVARKQMMTKIIRTVGKIASDPALYQAEEEFLQAGQALAKAREGGVSEIVEQASRMLEASRMKLRLLGFNDELIDELAQSGKPDRSLLLSEPGGKAWVYAPVYEYEIPFMKTGQTLTVELAALPGEKVKGIIRAIDSVVDPMTRTARIRAQVDNPGGMLKPEMFVNTELEVILGEVLAVPEEAVFATGERSVLFVAKPGGVFEPREVTAGAKAGGYVEIRSGISEGENVVISGNFLMDSESRLKGALEGAVSGAHQH